MPKRKAADPSAALRAYALRYPEATSGVACAGTALECPTVAARGKAFLFLGPTGLRVKVRESLDQATEFAAREPGRYTVGAHGWVQVVPGEGPLPLDVLERWIDESYRLLVPKALVAMLPEKGPPAEERAPAGQAATRPARKPRPR